jgi:hypothetical protein
MGALIGISALWAPERGMAQKLPDKTSEPHQMILTKDGFVAIDVPKGWVQTEGPGLAFFLPEGVEAENAEAWIYISSAPVGPNEEDKNLNSYIQSDISGYKQRFKNATVHKEDDLLLSEMKQTAQVYTFESGETHNAFEQVVYIPDAGRVLILALSAKNLEALKGTLATFHAFAKSYRGSMQMGSPKE